MQQIENTSRELEKTIAHEVPTSPKEIDERRQLHAEVMQDVRAALAEHVFSQKEYEAYEKAWSGEIRSAPIERLREFRDLCFKAIQLAREEHQRLTEQERYAFEYGKLIESQHLSKGERAIYEARLKRGDYYERRAVVNELNALIRQRERKPQSQPSTKKPDQKEDSATKKVNDEPAFALRAPAGEQLTVNSETSKTRVTPRSIEAKRDGKARTVAKAFTRPSQTRLRSVMNRSTSNEELVLNTQKELARTLREQEGLEVWFDAGTEAKSQAVPNLLLLGDDQLENERKLKDLRDGQGGYFLDKVHLKGGRKTLGKEKKAA